MNCESVYSLRYQVYCHEANFLNPENYSDGLEHDEFDPISEHFSVTNPTNRNEAIGTIRLIRWTLQHSFPTVKYCPALLEHLRHLQFPLESTAEISRLCITKQFKRQATHKLSDSVLPGRKETKGKLPNILFKLFRELYISSKYACGITHWIAAFEAPLYRLLERHGINFKILVEDEIDYYGKVKIYGASLQHLETEIKNRKSELCSFLINKDDQRFDFTSKTGIIDTLRSEDIAF